MRWMLLYHLRHGADVVGSRSATPAPDIGEAVRGKVGVDFRHLFGGVVVAAEGVGKAGVGVDADVAVGHIGQLFEVGSHVIGAEGAVDADGNGFRMLDAIPEGGRGLAGEGPAGFVGNGNRDHDRQPLAGFFKDLFDGEEGGLGVEGVENGFDQQDVYATFYERTGLFSISGHEVVEGDGAVAGVVHVGGDRSGAVGRADGASHEEGAGWVGGQNAVHGPAGHPGCCKVQFANQRFKSVVGLGNGRRTEGVGFNDIRSGLQELHVDLFDDLRPGDDQQVIVALEVGRMVSKPRSAEIGFLQLVFLDHRPHGAVDHQHLLVEQWGQLPALFAGVF